MKPAPPAYLTEADEAQDHEIITEPVISEAEFLEAQAQMIELEALEAADWLHGKVADHNAAQNGTARCTGDHCEGNGLTEAPTTICGWCSEIEYGIWLAEEPD